MWKGINKAILLFGLLFLTFPLGAQVNDPFSGAGFGTFQPYEFTLQRSMGGLSAAISDPRYINPVNPASYADFYVVQKARFREINKIKRKQWDAARGDSIEVFVSDTVYRDTAIGIIKNTSFQTSIDLEFYNTSNQNLLTKSSNGSLGYLALAFPLPKLGGISMGVMPYSNVNYNVIKSQNIDSIGQVDYRYSGNGGLYQFYTGIGMKFKNLRFGINARYIFGSIQLSEALFLNEQNNALGTRQTTLLTVRGTRFDGGLIYKGKIAENIYLKAGAFVNSSATLFAHTDTLIETIFFNSSGNMAGLDSIRNASLQDKASTMPLGYGGGFVIEKPETWMFGAEYRAEDWSRKQGLISDIPLGPSWRVSVGGQIIPNFKGGFLEKLNYRFGGYYARNYVLINNMPVLDYGMTFGFGIPIIRPREVPNSTIDLSFQVGKTGDIRNNLLAENYFRISLGFNMNDNSWIFKSKFY